MIARLFMTMLLACLTLPALAMALPHHPAAPVSGMAMAHHESTPSSHHSDSGHDAMADHACIGCIPPVAGLTRAVSPNGFAMTVHYPAARVASREGASPSPDTPPPKLPA